MIQYHIRYNEPRVLILHLNHRPSGESELPLREATLFEELRACNVQFFRTTYKRQLPEIPICFPGSHGMNRNQMSLWIRIELHVKPLAYGTKTPL